MQVNVPALLVVSSPMIWRRLTVVSVTSLDWTMWFLCLVSANLAFSSQTHTHTRSLIYTQEIWSV